MNRIRSLLAGWRRIRRDEDGSMLIELAFAMPLVAALLLGGVEVGRYVLLHQKLDRVASSTADLVSQAEKVSTADIQNVFDAAEYVAAPFDLSTSGTVIVSSITNPLGSADSIVNWQQTGAGTATAASRLGTAGGPATLPDGFTLADGETIIVAEVFYDYAPWLFSGYTSTREIYEMALYRPRYGGLTMLSP